MEYKLTIFSLIILIGILGTGFHYEKIKAPELKDWQEVSHLGSKNDHQQESFFFQHTVSHLKKCCQSLFFEREKDLALFRKSFFLFIRSISASESVNAILGQININAP